MKNHMPTLAFGLAAVFLTMTGITKIGYAAAPSPASGAGDAANGKKIYTKSCASCHGPTGMEGAIGPSLKGEKSKKNAEQMATFMKTNPGPMPKLFPKPLSEQDITDVVAYMNTL